MKTLVFQPGNIIRTTSRFCAHLPFSGMKVGSIFIVKKSYFNKQETNVVEIDLPGFIESDVWSHEWFELIAENIDALTELERIFYTIS